MPPLSPATVSLCVRSKPPAYPTNNNNLKVCFFFVEREGRRGVKRGKLGTFVSLFLFRPCKRRHTISWREIICVIWYWDANDIHRFSKLNFVFFCSFLILILEFSWIFGEGFVSDWAELKMGRAPIAFFVVVAFGFSSIWNPSPSTRIELLGYNSRLREEENTFSH